jgi:UDP-N-acetylmuramoylalanine--D-glutamate ligase
MNDAADTRPTPETLRPQTAVVYGLGVSGRAAARLLTRHGARVTVVDDRGPEEMDETGGYGLPEGVTVRPGGPETLAAAEAPDADVVVLSPGVPGNRPLLEDARRHGVPILAEVEAAFPHVGGPILAITGSNGKSTTTALTGKILEAAGRPVAVCGNIGQPVSEAVLEDAGRVFVVELSSFQLESIRRFRPRGAAYLNLTPDHLDRYDGLDDYAAAKERIFRNQTPEDVAVVNGDDPRTRDVDVASRKRLFSRRGPVSDGCWLDGEQVIETGEPGGPRVLFTRDDLTLEGGHNLENAMAAALLVRSIGLTAEEIRPGLAAFTGLPHRMEKVAEIGGVAWWNDSKGTNTGATLSTLGSLEDGAVHLILGGKAKGEDFTVLRELVGKKAARVYLIGAAADEIGRALEGAVPLEHCGTLDRAVAAAAEHAERGPEGQLVLLSPACASFDQYDSFAHRGRAFTDAVRRLERGEGG